MKCYHCGRKLSEKDFCTGCGADVSLYKKILYTSNRFYNEGLEKAGVRDLSGAVVCLKQSLKFNKNHIEARNLLGLVYYEMGEVVRGLGEWVISKNLQPEKNIADDYIRMIQANPNRLETINQTIKKYNQALNYCQQESLDLAVIQLKKVLSLNPNYVRAHQLLALLCMHNEDWERAEKELEKCNRIDAGNTTTKRYQREVRVALELQDSAKGTSRKKEQKKNSSVVQYQSGNETIIQPIGSREGRGFSPVLNILIGLGLGIAATYFLIVPAKLATSNSVSQEELRLVSEELDKKTSSIEDLNQQIQELTAEKEELETQLNGYEGSGGTMNVLDGLLLAVNAYVADPQDIQGISEALENVDATAASQVQSKEFQTLYKMLMEKVGPSIAASYYETAMREYRAKNYTEAAKALEKAVVYDDQNPDIYYNLGNAYRESGNVKKALEAYRKVVEIDPDTADAKRAARYAEDLEDGSVAAANTTTGNATSANSASGNTTSTNNTSANNASANNVTSNDAAENPVPADQAPGNDVPADDAAGNPITENNVSADGAAGNDTTTADGVTTAG